MTVTIHTEAQHKAALRAYQEESIATFREAIEYADIPLQTYALFCFLPEHGSISMSEVVKLFKNLSQASVSRNVDILAGTSRLRSGGGYKLVERLEDAQDRRFKTLQLSREGKALRDKMHLRSLAIYKKILGVKDNA